MKNTSLTKLRPILVLAAGMLSLVCLNFAPAADSPGAMNSDATGWADLMPAADLKNWTRIAIPPKNPLGRAQWHLDAARQVLVCDGDGWLDMLRFDRELTNCTFHGDCRFVLVTS